jgi:hypothetical protein
MLVAGMGALMLCSAAASPHSSALQITEASWSAQEQSTAEVSALTVSPPAPVNCSNTGLGGILQTATLQWNNVALPTMYRVTVDTGTQVKSTDIAEGTGSSTSTQISTGLLGDLLGSLGTLLGNGQILTVRIQSIFVSPTGNMWISPASTSRQVKYVSLLAGTACA